MSEAESSGEAPMIGLSHVQLIVTDLAASVDWYTAALGVAHYAGDVAVGYVALRHRGAGVVIVLAKRAQDRPGAAGQRPEHLDHLAFAVPDGDSLRGWADHLAEIGIEHAGVVLENGNPSLQLQDPDGIAIELVAPGAREGSGRPGA
jgi:catechol-2,3-dioxygenase